MDVLSDKALVAFLKVMANNDIGGDGPSRQILKYMKENNWVCPEDWQGYRPLISK